MVMSSGFFSHYLKQCEKKPSSITLTHDATGFLGSEIVYLESGATVR